MFIGETIPFELVRDQAGNRWHIQIRRVWEEYHLLKGFLSWEEGKYRRSAVQGSAPLLGCQRRWGGGVTATWREEKVFVKGQQVTAETLETPWGGDLRRTYSPHPHSQHSLIYLSGSQRVRRLTDEVRTLQPPRPQAVWRMECASRGAII